MNSHDIQYIPNIKLYLHPFSSSGYVRHVDRETQMRHSLYAFNYALRARSGVCTVCLLKALTKHENCTPHAGHDVFTTHSRLFD
jgi:hypothetical protein